MIKYVSDALAKRAKGDKGFTLIELLVVVIIIGILAAVAVPVFLNMREGAWKSSVESDLSNAALAVEAAMAENNGSLNGVTFTLNATTGVIDIAGKAAGSITISEGNTLVVKPNADNVSYKIGGKNENLTGTTDFAVYDSQTGGLGGWGEGTYPTTTP